MSARILNVLLVTLLFYSSLNAQEGQVTIRSNEGIKRVLALKKELNTSQQDIKIQIYSGSRQTSEDILTAFESEFPEIEAAMVYETPSYKIWVGDYRTQIQADRALIEIRKKYSAAFSFRPKATD